MRRFLAVLLVFCGLAATALAATRPVQDTMLGVDGQTIRLRELGTASMAGIYLLQPTAPAQPLDVTLRGHDRHGRPIVSIKRGKLNLAEEWVRQGTAIVYDRAASPKGLVKAERAAEQARRGAWGEPGFVRTPTQAEASMGEFILVRGPVSRTYKGRDMHYINFGEDWRTDFSLRIPRRAWRSFGADFAIADGSCVRARGVVFEDNGPMIEITRPEQLEFVLCHGTEPARQ